MPSVALGPPYEGPPNHKYIHDVYKYLSHNTQYTHNTHNPYVYGIGEKSTTEFSVVLLLCG